MFYTTKIKTLPEDYEEDKYTIENNELKFNENYEKEKKEKERIHINNLYLTAADVERGIYKAKGIDFDDIIALVTEIETNDPETKIDIKALKIELKANHFYRGNPYIDTIGSLLGFTSLQLDNFFKTKDYTHLISKSEAC